MTFLQTAGQRAPAVGSAVREGRLEELQQLVVRLGIRDAPDEVRSIAIGRNYLSIEQLLISNNIGSGDITEGVNGAVKKGHIQVIAWLF